ncbi:MAG: twin transmembrane helix small protein [Woeseiaceae bacterium]
MKIIVLLLLAAIVVSLGSGLYHLSREDHDSEKVLKALKVRVALSLLLILFLVGSYFFGWIDTPTR